MFYFCHSHFSSCSNFSIKVTCCFPELDITILVSFISLDQPKVSPNTLFHYIFFPIESLPFFCLTQHRSVVIILLISYFYIEPSCFHQCSSPSRCVECRNPCSSCSQFLSQSALRNQFQFDLTTHILTLQYVILSHI